MWHKKTDYGVFKFIFVAPEGIPDDELEKLCEKYAPENNSRTLKGEALLVDLCGKEPVLVPVSEDYTRSTPSFSAIVPELLLNQSRR